MSAKLKIVTRGARYPRKYKKIRSFSLCDQNGQVVATIDFSVFGVHVNHLEGFPVNVSQMNGLGQYQLDGEPEASFRCPHCKEEDTDSMGRTRPVYSYEKKWAYPVGQEGESIKEVVCKRCGGGLIG